MKRTAGANSALSAKRRALLDKLLQQGGDAPAQKISARPEGEAPLSFAQMRLWFLYQLDPSTPLYNMPSAVRLTGALNLDALTHSLNTILRRHEGLRASFTNKAGQPVQTIAPAAHMSLPLIDLRALPGGKANTEVQRVTLDFARKPFDITRGPLLRVCLVQLSNHEHVLALTMHHIVSDGWSTGVLVQELATLYEAYVQGQQASLPPLPIQYADYAYWQNQWLQGETLETQLAYWKKQLDGALPVLALPTDRPRPATRSGRGAVERFDASPALTSALQTLSQQNGVSLFMTLLAAFKTLLYRQTGQPDVLVGMPSANRNRVETAALIGCFVNTLVLRTDLSDNPTFRELLKRVYNMAAEAYAHEDLPFEKLVEALQPDRSLSHTPLFQVMFIFQNTPADMALGSLSIKPVEVDTGTARFDLTLAINATPQGLFGVMQYDQDIFDASTIRRFLNRFEMILAALVAQPDQRILDIPLLNDAEQRFVIDTWNRVQPSETPTVASSIHELFESQVVKTPDAVAVGSSIIHNGLIETHSLTYAELNRRANHMAHYLLGQGVGPETRVAICVPRSLEMLTTLLGILKAGGTYLPLDPSFPPERLGLMLDEAQVAFILTDTSLLDALPQHVAPVVCIGTIQAALATQPETNPQVDINGDNLAYVLYTSGSTGRPKGVQIPHTAVVNFLESMRQLPGLESHDRLMAVTPLTFDIAGLELYLPLITGGYVEIASRDMTADGKRLGAWLEAHVITTMQATPALWHLLIESGWAGLQTLKILSGGEALPRDLAQKLKQRSASLWNMYGPTETTIWSAVQPVKTADLALTPIGQPIANTQVYILDSHYNPAPIGIPGELYIGGDGLARGYLNRPDLSAERFIPNPFAAVHKNNIGSRLYRTGDIARWLPSGSLEFMGRVDHQVKVRGFRIELGEIEVALKDHPDIGEAIVIAASADKNDATAGSPKSALVAYVVPVAGATPSVSTLRNFLKTKLPDYMIPTIFISLAALPLTPNGKVDRVALPQPDGLRPTIEADYIAPRNDVEQQVADIWQSVLKLEQVGINDNFFDLGGHSLLLMQVHNRLQETFAREIPVLDLFKYSNVRLLAVYLSTGPVEETAPAADPARVEVRRTVRAQQRQSSLQRRTEFRRNRGANTQQEIIDAE
jgi:amino acid adenylation domain-containing protein